MSPRLPIRSLGLTQDSGRWAEAIGETTAAPLLVGPAPWTGSRDGRKDHPDVINAPTLAGPVLEDLSPELPIHFSNQN